MIRVMRKLINEGCEGSIGSCPVAKAIIEATGLFEKDQVFVDGDKAIFNTLGITVTLPKKARKFISKFDRYKTVKPFSFSLEGAKVRSHAL